MRTGKETSERREKYILTKFSEQLKSTRIMLEKFTIYMQYPHIKTQKA